jgi:adenylylsulfate kinase-like enzyme
VTDVSNALKRLYQETSEFVVLGLTGRTGSGCSTVAKILEDKSPHFPDSSKIYDSDNDRRKYKIIRKFIAEN